MVSNIDDHSVPVATIALAVGATLVHVPVAKSTVDSFPNVSFIFARKGILVGSFCTHRIYVAFPVHPIHVLPLVLKLYGVVSNHTHAPSLGAVILKLNDVASVVDQLLKVKLGHCLSILITAQLFTDSALPAVSVL